MKLFFSERQLAHQPRQYMVHGKIVAAFENSDRATTLLQAFGDAGLAASEPPACGLEPLLRIHADHFIAFLAEAHAEFMKLPNHGPEVLPNIWSYRGADGAFTPRGKPRPTGIIGRADNTGSAGEPIEALLQHRIRRCEVVRRDRSRSVSVNND